MTMGLRRSAILASWLALVTVAAAVLPVRSALAAPNLPARTGAVTDQADILADGDERSLTDWARRIKQDSGTELVVVTLVSLQRQTIEDWGRALGRGWQVGGSTGNGIILIVAPYDREVRIEIGDGVSGSFSDGVAASIIRNVIIPKFKDGKLAAGTAAGVYAIADALSPKTYSLEKPVQNASWAKPELVGFATIAILVALGILALFIIYRALRDMPSGAITPEEERQRRGYYNIDSPRDRDRVVSRNDDDDRSSGIVFGGSRGSSGSWSFFGGSSSSWGSRGSSGSWSSGRSGGRSSGGGFGGGRGSSGKW